MPDSLTIKTWGDGLIHLDPYDGLEARVTVEDTMSHVTIHLEREHLEALAAWLKAQLKD